MSIACIEPTEKVLEYPLPTAQANAMTAITTTVSACGACESSPRK